MNECFYIHSQGLAFTRHVYEMFAVARSHARMHGVRLAETLNNCFAIAGYTIGTFSSILFYVNWCLLLVIRVIINVSIDTGILA